jgi:hypothetical protein
VSSAAGSRSSGVPARREHPDPLGKRALFWVPARKPTPEPSADPPAKGVVRARRTSDHLGARPRSRSPIGKSALFSNAVAHEDVVGHDNPIIAGGPIRVVCSRCGSTTWIGLLDLIIYQLPFGGWLPRGRFDHWMTCPACRKRVWASVTLRKS